MKNVLRIPRAEASRKLSRKLKRSISLAYVRNVLHRGSVAEAFAEAQVHQFLSRKERFALRKRRGSFRGRSPYNQIRRNKNHSSHVLQVLHVLQVP